MQQPGSSIISLSSQRREEFIDITGRVEELIAASGLAEGACLLFCRHTTAGLTVNENYDPDVKHDMLLALARMVPDDKAFRHAEGNSTAHVKASLMGSSLLLPVSAGRLALGRWQGVLFAEFDGPRQGRQVHISFLPPAGLV
ncbi:YjbQ family protein [bacterium]|nr:YjbQ family protein [bacterium]